ncbi:MAG: hypothetical protein HOB05_09920 [Bacteroidetes bacterium]|jgi:hypothetical protein|nr:hypothetical protein [Bacteroidota bacterium]MBT7144855.1 hypothetical protein [Bacteroidota bacterium]
MEARSRWTENKLEERIGLIGSSYSNAVRIGSISAEYMWLSKYYPDYNFFKQSMMFFENKPFDILKIETKNGKTKKVYFDISSFYSNVS